MEINKRDAPVVTLLDGQSAHFIVKKIYFSLPCPCLYYPDISGSRHFLLQLFKGFIKLGFHYL